jgi:hypothetical protein
VIALTSGMVLGVLGVTQRKSAWSTGCLDADSAVQGGSGEG